MQDLQSEDRLLSLLEGFEVIFIIIVIAYKVCIVATRGSMATMSIYFYCS